MFFYSNNSNRIWINYYILLHLSIFKIFILFLLYVFFICFAFIAAFSSAIQTFSCLMRTNARQTT